MGIIVGLVGVDGSGKSTTAKNVAKQLKGQGMDITVHHELDFVLLKPLFRLFSKLTGPERAENYKKTATLRSEQSKFLYSDIFYLLILLDNFVAYLYFKFKGGMMIADRWVYDVTTVFEHKNYRNKFVKTLFLLFPRPDIMILLTVPPKVAYLRKRDEVSHKDHGPEYYEDMSSRILEIAKEKNCDSIIDTDAPINEVVDKIVAIIKN